MERLKVLVVEDSKRFWIIYELGLTDIVFQKRFAEDGTKALDVYDNWQPDIVVLDIMLPGMSGYSVLKSIRDDRGDWTTVIIMASSLSDREAVVDCFKLGIQGFLVKPFTHRDVASRILGYFEKVDPQRAEAAKAELEASRLGTLCTRGSEEPAT
ncbi:MAG: PleD family two-component system response regulator [Syntrophobacteraceae bacterium]